MRWLQKCLSLAPNTKEYLLTRDGGVVSPWVTHEAEHKVTGLAEQKLLSVVDGALRHHLSALGGHEVQELVD